MILLLLAVIVGLLVHGIVHLVLAIRGIPAITRIVRTRTRPISELAEGDVELTGIVRAVGETVVSPSGRKCVVVDVALMATQGKGKQRKTVKEEKLVREAVADVVDATGATVRLDFANVEVVAPVVTMWLDTRTADPAARGYFDFGEKMVDDVHFIERAIEDGARVCVSGIARVVGSKVETTAAAYRDGVSVEKKSFVVAGSAGKRMLVSEGSEAMLLWRATWPVLALTAASTSAFLFAALVIQLVRA